MQVSRALLDLPLVDGMHPCQKRLSLRVGHVGVLLYTLSPGGWSHLAMPRLHSAPRS